MQGDASGLRLRHVAAVRDNDEQIRGEAKCCELPTDPRDSRLQRVPYQHREHRYETQDPDRWSPLERPCLLIEGWIVNHGLHGRRTAPEGPPMDSQPSQAGKRASPDSGDRT